MPSRPKLSVGMALLVGILWVTLPVLVIVAVGFLGLAALLMLLSERLGWSSLASLTGIYACAMVACVLGWLWWSVFVPKWRLWALERVDNWPRVKWWAIAIGLIWTDRTAWGRFFARTEIKSAAHAQQERTLEEKVRTRP